MQQSELLDDAIHVRRHANAIVIVLSVIYLAWQFLQPLVVLLVPAAAIGYLGTVTALALTAMTLLAHSREFVENGRGMFVWTTILVVLGSLSSLINGNVGVNTLSMIYQVASIACVFAAFATISRYEGTLRIIIWTLVIMAVLNALIAIWGSQTGAVLLGAERDQVGTGSFGYDAATGRAGGLRGENYSGAWTSPALAVGTLLALQWIWNFSLKGMFLEILGIGLGALSLVGVAVSLSRTSAACAGMVYISAVILNWKRKKSFLSIFVPLVLVLPAILIARVFLSAQSEHFTSGVSSDQSSRWGSVAELFGNRINEWLSAVSLGLRSALWGNGPGSTTTALTQVPHNAFLDVFVELGIFGMIVFFAPALRIIGRLFRKSTGTGQDQYLRILACILLGMSTAWLSLSSEYLKMIWIAAALVAGRMAFLRERDTQRQFVDEQIYLASCEEARVAPNRH